MNDMRYVQAEERSAMVDRLRMVAETEPGWAWNCYFDTLVNTATGGQVYVYRLCTPVSETWTYKVTNGRGYTQILGREALRVALEIAEAM